MASLNDKFPAYNPKELYVVTFHAANYNEITIFPFGIFTTEQDATKFIATVEECAPDPDVRHAAGNQLIVMRLDVLFQQYRHFNKDHTIAVDV